jgi:VCBS repeat-containing protein
VQALNVGGQLTDTFTVATVDGTAQLITVTIDGANDAPVGANDAGSATEAGGTNNGTAGSNAAGNVLTNDTDVDNTNASLVVSAVRTGTEGGTGTAGTVGTALTGAHGTLTLNANGTYTYVVNNSDNAVQALNVGNTLTDTFTYTVKDPGNLTDTAQLTVTINGSNDAPVNAVPGAQPVNENTPLVFSSASSNLISIADVDNSSHTVILTASHGTLTLSGVSGLSFTTGDGTADATMTFSGTDAAINAALAGMSFAPTTGFTGSASVQIVTTDGGGLSDTDSVAIAVNAVDTTADAPPFLTLTSVTSQTDSNNFTAVTLTVAGFDSDIVSSTITLTDIHGHTATHTLTASELATATSTGSVAISSWTNLTTLAKNDNITATVQVTDAVNNTATHQGAFQKQGLISAPAGVAGDPINLGLTESASSQRVGAVSLMIAGVPSDWTINGAMHQSDGSWVATTADPSALTVTMPSTFAGAALLNISETWTNADGSTGTATIADNVEAYAPGSPIFAVSGDDTLTGSSGADEFVFAQPVGNDTVYDFDTASDTVDLIGFGIAGFAVLQPLLANDADGNALITLGGGETITLKGVDAASLTAANFVFDAEPVTTNAGTMTIGDGAILPLGGTIENTGVISLGSTGDETDLEILVRGATLEGGGQVTLSDSADNVIFGGTGAAVLTNVDNTISGAGQLGDGQLTLVNQGTIVATGSNALVIDTAANTVTNSGMLEATGAGGLDIKSALVNTGTIEANGGNVTAEAAVTGGGNAIIAGGATLEFGAASDANVSFADGTTGTLLLEQSLGFSGTVAGFGAGDTLDFGDIAFGANTTLAFSENAAGTGGTLAVGDGAETASIALLGQYAASAFVESAGEGGGTAITYTAQTPGSTLATPQV